MSLSRVQLPKTLWTAAYQASPSMGLSRQEYWSGVPLPSPKMLVPLLIIYTNRPKNEIAVSCLCSNFVFLKERACYTPQCLFQFAAATAAKSLLSCLTLCDPIDSGPLGSSIPGILQARILEWVAISFSNA